MCFMTVESGGSLIGGRHPRKMYLSCVSDSTQALELG